MVNFIFDLQRFNETTSLEEGSETQIKTSLSGNDLDITVAATQGQGSVTVGDSGEITYDATNGTLQISVPLENVIGDSLLRNYGRNRRGRH